MSEERNEDSASKIKTVKAMYAALNSGDVAATMQYFHQDIERVEWEGSPSEGRFHGTVEMTKHISQGRSTWAEGGCEPEEFIVVGEYIVVPVHVRVRLKDKTEWLDGRVADVYRLKDGKIVVMRSFMSKGLALEWASAH